MPVCSTEIDYRSIRTVGISLNQLINYVDAQVSRPDDIYANFKTLEEAKVKDTFFITNNLNDLFAEIF